MKVNDLQVFKNSEFSELSVLVIGGREYFPATACAKVLGYTNPQKAIRDQSNLENNAVKTEQADSERAKKASKSPRAGKRAQQSEPVEDRFRGRLFN
jgi:prophage antirepressor-like protein